MGSRHRSRRGATFLGGSYQRKGQGISLIYPTTWSLPDWTCDDSTGNPHVDHAFTTTKYKVEHMGTINGKARNGWTDGYYIEAFDMMPEAYRSEPVHSSCPDLISENDCAMKVLARTNPGRAEIGTLENLVDIRDLPKLFKLASGGILRKIAGANLSWQFGWKPLLSDLSKMMQFTNLADRRLRELKNLYQKGGTHRKIHCGESTVHTDMPVCITSGTGIVVNGTVSSMTTAKRWASVRWTPTTRPPDISDPALLHLANRAVGGLYLNASNAWDAIPWSWLGDWFSNFGDWLHANNQFIPCQASTPCVMTRTETRRRIKVTDNPSNGWMITPYDVTKITKTRSLVTATVTASLPILTKRQLSILGSLAIMRSH